MLMPCYIVVGSRPAEWILVAPVAAAAVAREASEIMVAGTILVVRPRDIIGEGRAKCGAGNSCQGTMLTTRWGRSNS